MDERDQLIEMLLCEVLGGEEPPDLTARVMARAFPKRHVWEARFVPLAAAAAVLLVVGTALAVALRGGDKPAPYPSPQLAGAAQVTGGGDVARGATLSTGAEPASLSLGGYCRVEMNPETTLRIEGAPQAEQVFLDRGVVTCAVDRAHGAFAVRTDVGTVKVTGTEFSVEVAEKKGEGPMMSNAGRAALWMTVAVMAGSVTVDHGGRSIQLAAGARQVFAADEGGALPDNVRGFSGQVRGIVTGKGDDRTIQFEALDVLRVWEKNAAKEPTALAGQTVTVGPRWEKGEDGEWRPLAAHLAFLDKLQNGQELVLEIRNVEGDQFAILELSQEQKDWASGETPRPAEHAEAPKEGGAWPELMAEPGEKPGPAPMHEKEQPKEQPKGECKFFLAKAEYVPKPAEQWQGRGRLVGKIIRGQEMKIAVLTMDKQVVKVVPVPAGAQGYEVQWLEPGSYCVHYATQNCGVRVLDEVKILANQDLVVCIEFPVSGAQQATPHADGEKPSPATHEGEKPAPKPQPGQEGMAAGILTAKDKASITVKLDGVDEPQRFMPPWKGGRDGGFDPQIVEAIAKIPTNNRVELKWKMDEHLRVLAIRMVQSGAKEGEVLGTIVGKGREYLDVKPKDGGPPERYTARWIGGNPHEGGGFCPKTCEALARFQVGDRIRLRWMCDERKRIVAVEKIGEDGGHEGKDH